MTDDATELSERLITPELQARLAAVEVALRRALPSSRRGDRRSPNKKGISLEFADYRGYVAGDDVRHLDWASYARLDQLIVKLYHDEEDAELHLLVDDSRSMRFGQPSKSWLARQTAAALAWIALRHAWRVSLTLLGDELTVLPPSLGEVALPRFLRLLEAAESASKRPLRDGVAQFGRERRPRGAVVLISDLFDPAGVAELIKPISRPSTEVTVVQVLAPSDVDPDVEGDLRLIDSESAESLEVDLSPRVRDQYRERVRHWIAGCAETCRRRGASFVTTTSDTGVETLLLRDMMRQGVLR